MNRPARRRAVHHFCSCTTLVAAFMLALTGSANAQRPTSQPHRWQIEVLGGWTGLTAADLNARVDYDTAVLNNRPSTQVQQDREGELSKVTRAAPAGGRVLRRLGRHWSVGAGFSFFTAEQRSAARVSNRYTVVDPRAQEYQREFSQTITIDPLVLTAREHLPHVLVRYDLTLAPRLRVGASLHGGWLVADFGIEREQTTEGGFYPISRRSSMEMTGRGGSLAGDAALVAHLAVTRRLGLLVEVGRGWHQVKEVTGTATTTMQTQDGEASEVELTQTFQNDGRWLTQPATLQGTSGTWQGHVPSVGGQGNPFVLNLSGWHVKLGVSLGL